MLYHLFILPLLMAVSHVKATTRSVIVENHVMTFVPEDDENIPLLTVNTPRQQDIIPQLPDEVWDHIFSFLSNTERYQLTNRLNKKLYVESKKVIRAIVDGREVDLESADNDWIWILSQSAVDVQSEYAEDVLDRFEEVLDRFDLCKSTRRLLQHPSFLRKLIARRARSLRDIRTALTLPALLLAETIVLINILISGNTSLAVVTGAVFLALTHYVFKYHVLRFCANLD